MGTSSPVKLLRSASNPRAISTDSRVKISVPRADRAFATPSSPLRGVPSVESRDPRYTPIGAPVGDHAGVQKMAAVGKEERLRVGRRAGVLVHRAHRRRCSAAGSRHPRQRRTKGRCEEDDIVTVPGTLGGIRWVGNRDDGPSRCADAPKPPPGHERDGLAVVRPERRLRILRARQRPQGVAGERANPEHPPAVRVPRDDREMTAVRRERKRGRQRERRTARPTGRQHDCRLIRRRVRRRPSNVQHGAQPERGEDGDCGCREPRRPRSSVTAGRCRAHSGIRVRRQPFERKRQVAGRLEARRRRLLETPQHDSVETGGIPRSATGSSGGSCPRIALITSAVVWP